MFQAHGGAAVPLCPEQRDHFAEGANRTATVPGPLEQPVNHRHEALLVRPAVVHERQQRLCRIERDVPVERNRRVEVEALHAKAMLELRSVTGRRDHDGALAPAEATGYESLQGVHQDDVPLVDLNEMFGGAHLAPEHLKVVGPVVHVIPSFTGVDATAATSVPLEGSHWTRLASSRASPVDVPLLKLGRAARVTSTNRSSGGIVETMVHYRHAKTPRRPGPRPPARRQAHATESGIDGQRGALPRP